MFLPALPSRFHRREKNLRGQMTNREELSDKRERKRTFRQTSDDVRQSAGKQGRPAPNQVDHSLQGDPGTDPLLMGSELWAVDRPF